MSVVAKRLYGFEAGWIKMPLGTEVGLSPGHFALDGDPAPPKRGTAPPPLFGPCLLWPNGCPSQLLLRACFFSHHPLLRVDMHTKYISPTVSAPLEHVSLFFCKPPYYLWPPVRSNGQVSMFYSCDLLFIDEKMWHISTTWWPPFRIQVFRTAAA